MLKHEYKEFITEYFSDAVLEDDIELVVIRLKVKVRGEEALTNAMLFEQSTGRNNN